MSGIEDEELDAPAVLSPEQEERDRKRALALISEALISAGNPLKNRGVNTRLLPGLWYAAMSVLNTMLSPQEIEQFLSSRFQTINGFGDNADSPARVLEGKAMEKYVADVQLAAETIIDKLLGALERMEELDIDDRFPEAVFDVALKVIMPAWGPDHVRRAIVEQTALIIKGQISIRNFMEPVQFMSQPERPKKPVKQGDLPEAAVERALAEYRVKRAPSDRQIYCFLATDRLEDGRAAWAITMRIISNSGRRERRDVYGSLLDKTGHKAITTVVHELALAICLEEGSAAVDIKVTDSAILKCLPDQADAPANYLKFDEAVWKEISACFAKHTITSKQVDVSLSDDQQERCEKLLRNPDQ